jgi:hypothetical protein
MVRLSLSTAALAASMLALAACASPEAELATTQTAPVAEAAPVEASTAALEPQSLVVQVADAEDAMTMPVNYSCSDNRNFVATFPEHGNSVVIAAAGDVRILSHKGASDAVLFADASGATLSAEGAGATLTGLGDGPYLDCMAG